MKINYLIIWLVSVMMLQNTYATTNTVLTGLNAKKSGENNMALGIKLGDPTAISFRKYLSGKSMIELNIGTSPIRYNYANRFDTYYKDRDFYYDNYQNRRNLVLQARYLLNTPLNVKGMSGLSVFYGAGVQARFTTLSYNYRYREFWGAGKGDYVWRTSTDTRTYTDVGFDAVLGMDWRLPDTPISLFVDCNMYFELFHKFFWVRPQGTIGGRLHF